MKLAEFIKPMSHEARSSLASLAGTTYWHLRNIAYSGKSCGIQLAVDIDAATEGSVRRWDLRPDDWHRIWPELIGTAGAPPVPAAVKEAA